MALGIGVGTGIGGKSGLHRQVRRPVITSSVDSDCDPNGTKIREIFGKNLDLDVDVDLDLDWRSQAAG